MKSPKTPDEDITEGQVAPLPMADRRAVEVWAEAKGMLPQFSEAGVVVPRAPGGSMVQGLGGILRSVAGKPNVNFWKFHAARARFAWVEGFECTEAEFDKAVDEAVNSAI